MRLRQLFLFLTLFSLQGLVFSQKSGYSKIENYTSDNYSASFSNWRVLQANSGAIMVANLEGLLEFDGKWRLYDSIGPIFELNQNDNSILLGKSGDVGYLKDSRHGNLEFHSLKDTLYSSFSEDSIKPNFDTEVVWSVTEANQTFYFYTKGGLYKWGNNNSTFINDQLNPYTSKFLDLENKIFSTQLGIGLRDITNFETAIPDSSLSRLLFIDSLEHQLLLATEHDGVLFYDGNSLYPASVDSKNLADNNGFFNFIKLGINKRYAYAASTKQSGIYIFDEDFNIVNKFNSESGIISNAIKNISLDNQQNLWIAAIGGISKIELNTPWTYYNAENQLEGAVFDFNILKGKRYAGTTEGIYQLKNDSAYKLYTAKVWKSDRRINRNEEEELIINTEQALFSFDGSEFSKVASGGLHVKVLSDNKTILTDVKGKGVAILREDDSINFDRQLLYEANELTIGSMVETDNAIWVASKGEGIFQFNDSTSTDDYFLHDYLLGDGEISLAILDNHLYAATEKKLYSYNLETSKFEPVVGFDAKYTALEATPWGTLLAGLKDGKNYRMTEISYDSSANSYIDTGRRFNRPNFGQILSFYLEGDSLIWVAASDGLYKYDNRINKNIDFEFNTLVRKVTVNDSLIFNGNYAIRDPNHMFPQLTTSQPEDYIFTFQPNENNFTFEFACTS
ncbi:hypothetical protein E1176_03010, partial [Fulvivirga sp. RKSG066]|uniref:hypothetical protein n=1 Tax=Fulvivirga aurantia TaxID=2529383 RepID=UPI0012BB7289